VLLIGHIRLDVWKISLVKDWNVSHRLYSFFLLLIEYALCSADHLVFGTIHIETYILPCQHIENTFLLSS